MKKLAVFLAAVAVFTACNNNISQNVVAYHDNGAPRMVTYYLHEGNDSILVKEEWYYADSALRMSGEYVDGMKSGEWSAWYEDGTPWSIGEFAEGKAHGLRIVYHENGNIYYKGQFTDGKRSGHWEFFDSKGELQKEFDY